MAAQTFEQTFMGYWVDESKLPHKSGVYFVYECTHNVEKNEVVNHKLIYIGESESVDERIQNHGKKEDWLKHVREGNKLCYGFTPINKPDRFRVEAAYINRHKPIENVEYVNNFPFDETTVITKTDSRQTKLDLNFTVYRKD